MSRVHAAAARPAAQPAREERRRGSPYLTREEEVIIGRRIAEGALECRNQLVVSNLGFVGKIAREYTNMGLPMDDLLNEGGIGLIHAASRFDHRRGTRFVTYASWWVRKSILKALAEQAWTIRVAGYQRRRPDRRRPSDGAGRGRRPPRFLPEAPAAAPAELYGYRPISLDAAQGPEGHPRLKETLVDHASVDPEREAILRESLGRLERCLADLAERERAVIARRFGLAGAPASTLKEIAEDLGLSRERVRQIEATAMGRLRAALRGARMRAGAARRASYAPSGSWTR